MLAVPQRLVQADFNPGAKAEIGYAVPAVYVFGAQCAFWVSATNAA